MQTFSLTQLRADYKAIRKENWPLACKIEMSYRKKLSQAAKKIRVNQLLHSAGKSLRTLHRWKSLYRLYGPAGIALKEKGRPPRKHLSLHIQSLIEAWRKKYRWGSEVIQAHLKYDHGITANRYQIDRFLGESGLRNQYP